MGFNSAFKGLNTNKYWLYIQTVKFDSAIRQRRSLGTNAPELTVRIFRLLAFYGKPVG